MAQKLRIYNTLTRRKEEFAPLNPPNTTLYSCGPTVYNYAHLGNLRTYVFADVLKRVLQQNGYEVLHVMNITDVGHLTSDADEGEDKMEKGAAREGKSVWDIAAFYTDAFMDDMHALNILDPSIWCKATDHIKEQIEQVKAIEAKGLTYRTSDGIYFDTSKLDDYGKLARLKPEDLEAGKRVSMGEKRHPTDFALWKFSQKGTKRQMEWPSPWGRGFPGWHIECSAMSSKYLGEHFDIHTGGIDHITVHHTNEIAQAEAAYGKKPWVRYWLHGEFLIMDQGKMAKSGETFLTLASLIKKGYDALDYRYLCLSAHYRQQLKFSWEAVETAKASRARLMNIVNDLRTQDGSAGPEAVTKMEAYEDQFLDAVNDDLNMPRALAVLWSGLRDAELGKDEKVELLVKFDSVLGLQLLEQEEEDVPPDVLALVKQRDEARARKDFTASDRLREEIQQRGFVVDDAQDGSRVKKV